MTKLTQINLSPTGGFKGRGPLGLSEGASSAPSVFNRIIATSIGIMTVIAFIWFVFLVLGGAYSIMTAGSDKAALEGARKKIALGVTGIIVIIAATFIISLIGELIGIPDILNPGSIFSELTI